jgi:hypothetical protein
MVCNDDGRIVIVRVKKMIILHDDNGGDSDMMTIGYEILMTMMIDNFDE